MPEIITRDIGLSFSYEELEAMFCDLKMLDRTGYPYYYMAVDFLEIAHSNNEFAGFGFESDLDIDEILGDPEGIYIYF